MTTFGLDNEIVGQFNKDLAQSRLLTDIKTDFIFAPHLDLVFEHAFDELYEATIKNIRSGTYNPKLPITLEVPKPSGFGRLGSILYPTDRLAYQLIADRLAPIIENDIDRSSVFSNVFVGDGTDDGRMFESSRESYVKFSCRVGALATAGRYKYVLRADVASYFEKLYQHPLINLLYAGEADRGVVAFLEKQLLAFTEKNSHGIIQGVYPSDLLGNYYLTSIDALHKINDIECARYVDDMYIFFESELAATFHQIELGAWLRKESLHFNEAKTKIYHVEELLKEENEIDDLFHEVIDDMTEFNPYDEQILWGSDPIDESEIDTMATKTLFKTNTQSIKLRTKIDKFCIPIFTALGDDTGLEYVLENFSRMPHLAKIYCNYLHRLAGRDPALVEKIESLLIETDIVFEYQQLWLYSLLLQLGNLSTSAKSNACSTLKNPNSHIVVRAICAIIIGRYGNPSQKRLLRTHYADESSEYVRAAIVYAAQYFSSNERGSCFSAWAGHSELNSLIITGIRNRNAT